MADIKIRRTDNAGVETTVEVIGLEHGAETLTNGVLEKLGYSGISEVGDPGDMMTLASSHELEFPLPYNMRAFRPQNITPKALRAAISEGRLDRIINPFDEIDVPLVDGGAVTVTCGYVTPTMARFVFTDCWDEGAMNDEATNKTGYYGSKGRQHVLEDILPKIAPEWRELMAPRKLSEIINGEKKEYEDPMWLPSATDMFGPSNGRWWNDEPDSFQLEIFKRERERIKELADKGTYPQWLRSVYATHSSYFCYVNADGGAYLYSAYNSLGFAPGFDIAAHDS